MVVRRPPNKITGRIPLCGIAQFTSEVIRQGILQD